MGRQDDAGTAVHPGQLLHSDGVAEHIQSRAAVFGVIGNAHQAHFSQLFHSLGGEKIFLVQLERDGFDLGLCESANFGPQGLMGFRGLV